MNLKTFEEFWPFSKKEPLDEKNQNQEKLKSFPKLLMKEITEEPILNYKISRIEIGFSKHYQNRLIIDLYDSYLNQTLRFNFKIDIDTNRIIEPDYFYTMSANRVELHSRRHLGITDFETELNSLKKFEDLIMWCLEREDLLKL